MKKGLEGGRRRRKGKGGQGSGGRRFFKKRRGRSNLADDQTDAWQAEGQWQQLCSKGNCRRPSVFHRSIHGVLHVPWEYTVITPYPCGPRTPWPNRAETTVRLFKRTWSIVPKALADEGYAEKVTVRQAVKKVAWARNWQLIVSGYSPLEIAI